MKFDYSFIQHFHCPSCGEGDLDTNQNHVICTKCQNKFPITNGIPWLFAEPYKQIHEWQNRYHFFIDLNKIEAGKMKLQLQETDLLEQTRDRLRRMIQGKVEHGREVAKILQPLSINFENTPPTSSLAAGTELPETQSLMSYYSNICRDWSYGEKENEICLREIEEVLAKDINLGTMGVIGTGAARLAYDMHRKFNISTTINLDINPFLILAAQRIIQGKTAQLYEFPIAPKNLESFAVKLKCKAPVPIKDQFHFTFSDGMNPIFKTNSLDTLLTPWLIDIVGQDIKDQFKRYNRCLKNGGHWINFGSLSFFHADQSLCYSLEETLKIIEESGFSIKSYRHEEIPYLHSPYSCQKRMERVLTFHAVKHSNVDQPALAYSHLPAWLNNWELPVPQIPITGQQAMIHDTLCKIFQLVDGKQSITTMAQAADFLQLSPENAAMVIANVLTKFYNEKLKGRQF